MSLLTEITKTAEAINVYGQSIQAAGKNIANVHNPDYAKQNVNIQDEGNYSSSRGLESFGISASKVTHARNKVLDEQIVREAMSRGSLSSQSSFTRNIEAYFSRETSGATDSAASNSSGGLANAISDFYSAFHELSSKPQESSAKQAVIVDSGILVDQFQSLSGKLTSIDDNIVAQTNSDIADANNVLDRIASINQQISQIEVGANVEALDLRDKLQSSLEELGEYANFEVKVIDNSHAGSIQIVAKDLSNNDVVLVDKAQVLNRLNFNGTAVETTAGTPITLDVTGGKIHGNLYSRSNTLAGVRTKLDSLANQFVTSVNAAYNPTSIVGENFFDSANLTAATISLDTNLTVTSLKTTNTTNNGASELIKAVAELANNVFSTGGGDQIDGTFSQGFSQITVDVGQDVNVVDKKIESQEIVERALKARRSESGSVSLDEEVADLLAFEKVVSGLGHYLKIVSHIFDSIVQGFV